MLNVDVSNVNAICNVHMEIYLFLMFIWKYIYCYALSFLYNMVDT